MSRGAAWLTPEIAYLDRWYGVIFVTDMDYLLKRHSRTGIERQAQRRGLKSGLRRAGWWTAENRPVPIRQTACTRCE